MITDQVPRILIVDDDEDLVTTLELLLKRQNYEVVKAYNGLECFPLIRETEPDLIILDITMPYVSGLEVIESLSEKGGISTPIIFLTASDDFDSKHIAYEHGAVDYVTKPFSTEELLAKIHSLLKMAGVA
ncbi:response regulator transcription factor [Bdellovibrionota bacterium]